MSVARKFPHREGRAIRARGLVQGVGFRPTVWRLAQDCGLAGEVCNDAEGVLIRVWGESAALDSFICRLQVEAPPLARIDTVESVALTGAAPCDNFRIVASHAGGVHTGVVPDAAVCPRCVDEVMNFANRRHRYPFTNCTHCGPRLSIVRTIPYDRLNTSMAEFAMCPNCQAEYDDPADRRFHAQPNACAACGPRVRLERVDGRPLEESLLAQQDEINAACDLLIQGKIIAIKGIGGFHLACDACNPEAVARLRERKRRFDKPFALMARDLDVICRYCAVTPADEEALTSSAAPIVVLAGAASGFDQAAYGSGRIADAVAPGQRSLGFMLPYTPLHQLLLRRITRPIVLTSGNLSEEPQCTDNSQSREKLSPIADYLLTYDREIVNRLDDSVVRRMDGEIRILRRARGYAPAPIKLPAGFERAPELLATGGELKNTFCLVKDGQAILSQHMGDLEDAATFGDYRKNLRLYRDLFELEPQAVVVDKHPEYLSSKLGRQLADREGLKLIEVQHHHAHIASCMAENHVPLNTRSVLGVALDGLGYGDDGTLWGGEFMLSSYAGYERLATFKPVAMPGGAQAIREPWRNAYAHIVAAIGWAQYQRIYEDLELTHFLKAKSIVVLDAMLASDINSPRASSCGRLFDAVAVAIGICRDRVSYEGQAAIELEAQVDKVDLAATDGYPFAITRTGVSIPTLDCTPMWPALLDDLARKTPIACMARRFHQGLARAIVELVCALKTQPTILGPTPDLVSRQALVGHRDELRPVPHEFSIFDTVALSGGVFQNKTLLEQVAGRLRARGFEVISHRQAPANDGGLSLGQAAIAAARVLKVDKSALGAERPDANFLSIKEQGDA